MGASVPAEIKRIIAQLSNKEIGCNDVPEEYRKDISIVRTERKLGLRTLQRRGYDVVRNAFFVEENIVYEYLKKEPCIRREVTWFQDFRIFYDYVDGRIYEDSCYFQCPAEKFDGFSVNMDRLFERKAFVEETIDRCCFEEEEDEDRLTASEAEKRKKLCKKWFKKFNGCKDFEQFKDTAKSYCRSKLCSSVSIDLFLYDFIFKDTNDENRFNIIMQYASCGVYWAEELICSLCYIYPPDKVIEHYACRDGSKQAFYKHKARFRNLARVIREGKVKREREAIFDPKSQFYVETILMETMERPKQYHFIFRCFETLEELIHYRNGDLRNTDLSKAPDISYDFSGCRIDNTTKLPVRKKADLRYTVTKRYKNGEFIITQRLSTEIGAVIKEKKHIFDYFFDCLAFLKNDLSDADLTMCDGLKNLKTTEGIDFRNAKMISGICEKFGLPYKSHDFGEKIFFPIPLENEAETKELYLSDREEIVPKEDKDRIPRVEEGVYKRIYYISDIHLEHRLLHYNAKSWTDAEFVIRKVVASIASEVSEAFGILLIDGDVAEDIDIFKLFVKILSESLRNFTVIFTLGNHELWGHSGKSFDEITQIYSDVISGSRMYLLQNDILWFDTEMNVHRINEKEIQTLRNSELRDKIKCSMLTVFGGLAFSGYNDEFNAESGIYQNTIDRETEIQESFRFENLYRKVASSLGDKPIIVMTHTPKDCWSGDKEHRNRFIYVSGHTHKNVFYDDGEIRIYADNQVGYHNESPRLKWFLVDYGYDCFCDYSDGIFEISADQYRAFYRGKNLSMSFNRKTAHLYMLKKQDYYCFIHKSWSGTLTILNGGALKTLPKKDLQYYFDNMEQQIEYIRRPLMKYTLALKKVSDLVRRFGGRGRIHGCIVDIDFNNHLYVNPIDLKVTAYWAEDIISKIVYSSLPLLLKERCPALYVNYQRLLRSKSDINLPTIAKDSASGGRSYLNTDIYSASREIRKMQKLAAGVLTFWNDDCYFKQEIITEKSLRLTRPEA